MKVVILSNLLPPNSRGGAEEVAMTEALSFKEEGHEVSILTLSPVNKFSVQEILGVRVYFLPHKNIFSYFDIAKKTTSSRFLWHIIDTFNFILANDIKSILKEEKPNLVISHNLKGLSFLTPKYINKAGFVNFQTIHDVSLYTPSGLIEYGKEDIFLHKGLLTRVYRFFTRKLFSYPEKIFFPSAWLLNFYRKNNFFINQEKIYRLNPIILPENNETYERANFLYVGQLEEHKGVRLLIDVFKDLSDKRLDIVGDGSLMKFIKNEISGYSNIQLFGKVDRLSLLKFYKKYKAVIVPSIVYENSPNVVAEAIKYGTMVIVSKIGGAYELIREGKNGYTFLPGDKEDLINKIKLF